MLGGIDAAGGGGWRSEPDSVSLRRFVPLEDDSFSPSEVAFIRIWCLLPMVSKNDEAASLPTKRYLVLELPHFSHRASHAISPPLFRCSSASFFNFSVSSSDQAPWFPALFIALAEAGGVKLVVLGPACCVG